MFLSESNFKRARDFIPERWLENAEFSDDRKECFNPFSLGPRGCIGIKYVTTRLE
jgi:cytochrome P450